MTGRSAGSRRFAAAAAIVFGSGLSVIPEGATVQDEVSYAELGWPQVSVAGHAGRLVLAGLGGARLLLACGRPHLYEGWSREQLARPVADMASWGARRMVLTNACGGLASAGSAGPAPGSVVVVEEVVDLQEPPRASAEPLRLAATAPRLVTPCEEALRPFLTVRRGRYVAVPGPQYETPAEAAWLSRFGDTVGMSTAPEVRAAREHGLQQAVLALVVNTAGAAVGHEEVLAAAAGMAERLRRALPALLRACWPDIFGA